MAWNFDGWPPRPIYDRPHWPLGVGIAAQALDAFADWCIAHPDDCIVKQVQEYADEAKLIPAVRTYVEDR